MSNSQRQDGTEQEMVRAALLQAGFQVNDEDIVRLIPLFRALCKNHARISALLPLSIELQVTFDPRWRT